MALDNRMEALISNHMKHLGCTREEAIDIIEQDKVIDKGGRTEFDLDPEKEKIAKKFANTGTRKAPTAYKFETRKRKENPTKAAIIQQIFTFLAENVDFSYENVEILNKERMISFKVDENSFELTLVQKRKPKT